LLHYAPNGTLEAGRFEGPTPPDTHPNTAIFLVKRLMILAAMAAMTWTPPLAAQAPEGGQLLRPGDVIRLNIWREPDMSGEYVIDEAGSVIFPRVGEYFVLEEDNASKEEEGLTLYVRGESRLNCVPNSRLEHRRRKTQCIRATPPGLEGRRLEATNLAG
jgi:hypothetical protein